MPTHPAYTGNLVAYGDFKRSTNSKLRTVKTPEPRYNNSLLLEKGVSFTPPLPSHTSLSCLLCTLQRFSPAFSSYGHFLDRINNTISSDK
jgi:hypothetical protein